MINHQFSYMLQAKPIIAELAQLGIKFEAVDVGSGEPYPVLILPSGAALAFSKDDEGNGPGVMWTVLPKKGTPE